MKTRYLVAVLLVVGGLLGGCASNFTKGNQDLFNSSYPGQFVIGKTKYSDVLSDHPHPTLKDKAPDGGKILIYEASKEKALVFPLVIPSDAKGVRLSLIFNKKGVLVQKKTEAVKVPKWY